MPMISANGTRLNVAERGGGPPVLLVHGFPLDHSMWQAQLDGLSDAFRVIAPDLRGFGNSDPAGDSLAMDLLADDLAALLDALDVHEPVTYCGLSMGGYVGWQFLQRHARRMRALILCDTRAAADTPEARNGRRELAEKVLDVGPEAAATAMLPKLFAESTRARHPEIVERVRQTIIGTRRETIAAALAGMSERPDATRLLESIEVPTLLLVGRHDALSTPAEMRGMAERIPGAQFVEVPDAGHMAPLENPEFVTSTMRTFLASR